MMCNEKNITEKINDDYRFLDYRLTQLENTINKGLNKLEHEQDINYKELIKMLRVVQENSNHQNEKLVEIEQREQAIEEKLKDMDKIKKSVAINAEQINTLKDRLNRYNQVIIGITIATASAFLMALVQLL